MVKESSKQEEQKSTVSDVSSAESVFSESSSIEERRVVEPVTHHTVHKEVTLDFSALSKDTLMEDVEDKARQVEEENLVIESPLDKYVRTHRVEVERAKANFGADIDTLIKKERALVKDKKTVKSTRKENLTIDSMSVSSDSDSTSIDAPKLQKDIADEVVDTSVEGFNEDTHLLEELVSVEQLDAVTIIGETDQPIEAVGAVEGIAPDNLTGSDVTLQEAVVSSEEADLNEVTGSFVDVSDEELSSKALEGELLDNVIKEALSTEAPSKPKVNRVVFPIPREAEHVENKIDTEPENSEAKISDKQIFSRGGHSDRIISNFDAVIAAPATQSVHLPEQETQEIKEEINDAAPKTLETEQKLATKPASFSSSLTSVASKSEETASISPVTLSRSANKAKTEELPAETPFDEKKSHKKGIIIGVVAVAAIAAMGGGYAVYQGNAAHTARLAKIQQATDAAVNTFKKSYDAFFTDSTHQALKNTSFSNLSQLKSDLDKIPTTTKNDSLYKTEYSDLSNDITAIQSVNAIFNKPVIVDGKLDDSATVKSGSTIPSVSSTNTTLNTLLKDAISLANHQLTAASSAAAASSSAAAASSSAAASSAAASSAAASSAAGNSSNNSNNSNNSSAGTTAEGGYSQNPYGVAPNNTGSRVPIQNINPNDPAFAWAPGILTRVISTCQSRGYITGNAYILEPVAIGTTGDGWYNLYRPDGTYLVSINCKTGFFAGNGGKHPTFSF